MKTEDLSFPHWYLWSSDPFIQEYEFALVSLLKNFPSLHWYAHFVSLKKKKKLDVLAQRKNAFFLLFFTKITKFVDSSECLILS